MAKKKGRSQRPPTPPLLPTQEDNDSLVDDLFAQLGRGENQDFSVPIATQEPLQKPELPKQNAKSRFLARQTRKTAALQQANQDNPAIQARRQQEIKEEEEAIQRTCRELGLEIFEINPDGHCLFSAVADQLSLLGILPSSESNYKTIRRAAADYIQSHVDDFIPFLPSAVDDGNSDTMSLKEFGQYCASIRDTAEWGGELEILALSRTYNVAICVIQAGPPTIVKHDIEHAGSSTPGRATAFVSYHKKLYGLGEHYNSLRQQSRSLQVTACRGNHA